MQVFVKKEDPTLFLHALDAQVSVPITGRPGAVGWPTLSFRILVLTSKMSEFISSKKVEFPYFQSKLKPFKTHTLDFLCLDFGMGTYTCMSTYIFFSLLTKQKPTASNCFFIL